VQRPGQLHWIATFLDMHVYRCRLSAQQVIVQRRDLDPALDKALCIDFCRDRVVSHIPGLTAGVGARYHLVGISVDHQHRRSQFVGYEDSPFPQILCRVPGDRRSTSSNTGI
jgi:hypothetical protein